jgi:hypothetical protein
MSSLAPALAGQQCFGELKLRRIKRLRERVCTLGVSVSLATVWPTFQCLQDLHSVHVARGFYWQDKRDDFAA